MKKFLSAIVSLFTLVLLLAIISNPDSDDHVTAVKGKVMEKVEGLLNNYSHPPKVWQELLAALTTVAGREWVDQKINLAISTENYILFSLTKLTVKDKSAIVSVGMFGEVWMISEGLEAMDYRELISLK